MRRLTLIGGVFLICASSMHAQGIPSGQRVLNAKTLHQIAEAMGGLERIRAVKNQVVISEGDYFEPQQALTPSGPPRHVSHFRAEMTRELGSGRFRQDWSAEIFYVFKAHVRYVRIIDGRLWLC